MAQSPAHKFGQLIGDLLEEAVAPLLEAFAQKHDLYLDMKGPRAARGGKKKISWVDLYGNTHDLDFVLEQGGTPKGIGTPVAFIETAWRRYTKHSRNKAQEIQGAILPLAAAHQRAAPFIGVILAGDYTEGAVNQLKSLGFSVLHFPYGQTVKVFAAAGIDAHFDEDTPDREVKKKVATFEKLSLPQRKQLAEALLQAAAEKVRDFTAALERSATRQIDRILVLPLHGDPTECRSATEAIEFIRGYGTKPPPRTFVRYEIDILFNNKARIQAQFPDSDQAVAFLGSYEPPLRPAAKGDKDSPRSAK
jgi:hypothetical protein